MTGAEEGSTFTINVDGDDHFLAYDFGPEDLVDPTTSKVIGSYVVTGSHDQNGNPIPGPVSIVTTLSAEGAQFPSLHNGFFSLEGYVRGTGDDIVFKMCIRDRDNTTPGKNAFLTATYCVIVPFAWWAIARKRPTAFNLIAAVLAVAGIGLVSLTGALEELSMGYGDFMTLVSALLFAIHIVYVSKLSLIHI